MSRITLAGEPGPGRLRFSPVTMASVLLVAAGLVLGAAVDMAWLCLFALGVFGPPLLRLAGLLRDQDEFQREAARRAGHHAYLAGGLFLVVMVIVRSWGVRNLEQDRVPAAAALVVLLVVYLLSYLTSFWGARKAAMRILLVFGLFWLGFVVLENRGVALLMQSLVPLPLLALALLSRWWPRTSGAVLLGLGVFAGFFFKLERALSGSEGALIVILLLVVPVLFAAIALLGHRSDEEKA
jgi:hypothetical protein